VEIAKRVQLISPKGRTKRSREANLWAAELREEMAEQQLFSQRRIVRGPDPVFLENM
jgi:hypothetical protein